MPPSILPIPALISVLAAPAVVAEASTDPEAPTTPGLRSAHVPALGLQVRSVGVDTGAAKFELTPRAWADVVAENPALQRDQRRAELFAPGVAGVALGSLWLVIATAITIDEFHFPEARRNEVEAARVSNDVRGMSAREVTGRFILPSALLISGIWLASTGSRARGRLERARDAFFVGPQLARGGGGVSVGGMF